MKPVLQALLLADCVIEDKATGKKTVVGIFNRLFIRTKKGQDPEPPAQEAVEGELKTIDVRHVMRAGSPFAYMSMTEVYGSADLILRYVDLVDNSILFQVELALRVEHSDPLKTFEMTLPLPPLPHPHVGTYALELLYREELLGVHRVTVEQIEDAA